MKLLDLSTPKNPNTFSMVDDDDFERLDKQKWRLDSRALYGIRSQKPNKVRAEVLLHREVMGAVKGQEIHHINGNTLDNQKGNLRFCTRQENNRCRGKTKRKTTSKYVGVFWSKNDKGWKAMIKPGPKPVRIGVFQSEDIAAQAYNDAASKYFGEFAKLNVIQTAPIGQEGK